MSGADHIIGLLTSLTNNQIDALPPLDRRLLQDQVERVHRIMRNAHKARAREGGETRRGRAAFLDELRDGRGRE